jgi:hypothetical protein
MGNHLDAPLRQHKEWDLQNALNYRCKPDSCSQLKQLSTEHFTLIE